MKKEKKQSIFKRGNIGFRILIFTFIYLFLLGSFLSPLVFNKEYNHIFAIVVASIVTVIYIVIIIYLVIDYKKNKN